MAEANLDTTLFFRVTPDLARRLDDYIASTGNAEMTRPRALRQILGEWLDGRPAAKKKKAG